MATKTAKAKATTKKVAKKQPTIKHVSSKGKASKAVTQSQFMEARITDQTIYWMIFGAAAIVFALWLFSLDAKVRDLYDQIDTNAYTADPALHVNPTVNEAE